MTRPSRVPSIPKAEAVGVLWRQEGDSLSLEKSLVRGCSQRPAQGRLKGDGSSSQEAPKDAWPEILWDLGSFCTILNHKQTCKVLSSMAGLASKEDTGGSESKAVRCPQPLWTTALAAWKGLGAQRSPPVTASDIFFTAM